MASEPDAAVDADSSAPDTATAPEAAPDQPLPRLTARRFLGAFALTSVLYFLFLLALASLGAGILSLVAALLFALAAARRLTRIRGWRPWLTIAVAAFFLVNVTAYLLIVTLLAVSGNLPSGG